MTSPYFGIVTPEMEAAIRPHILGKVVWDLGAGNMWHSKMLIRLGATRVVAVDKADYPMRGLDPRIQKVRSYFKDIPIPQDGFDVAYLAWPINHTFIPGLEAILIKSRTVIYIGSNVGGSACGNLHLMTHLASRIVLGHIPHKQNTLAIYGDRNMGERTHLPEEWAALHPERMWSLDEAIEASSWALRPWQSTPQPKEPQPQQGDPVGGA